MQIISVVRNFDMYNRLVRNNPYYGKDAHFIAFDNTKENKSLTTRYNNFLENYDFAKADWFVFCHEDWELKEDLQKILATLDKNCLYGPIGLTIGCWFTPPQLCGRYIQSEKDGSRVINFKKLIKNNIIGTFDCQCLIVHSELVKKYGLRFDENLSFDLYVEDFCINAKENYHIPSKILYFKCQHYSYGNATDAFYTQLTYLQNKYKDTKNIYSTTVHGRLITKRRKLVYFISCCLKAITRFLYQSKITNSGHRLIKVCKIPIYKRAVTSPLE